MIIQNLYCTYNAFPLSGEGQAPSQIQRPNKITKR